MPTSKTIMSGTEFCRWTVLSEVNQDGNPLCRCSCGVTKFVTKHSLIQGTSKSCGCLRRKLTSERRIAHGHTAQERKTKIYIVWRNMLSRCRNPKSDDYHNYGGRGISVCDRWLKFENFLEDMGEPPPGLTIDRADSNGNYCKENCSWATPLQQGRNRRNVVKLTFDGKTKTIGEWAEQLGVPRRLLSVRYHRGWTLEKLLVPALKDWDRSKTRSTPNRHRSQS